MDGKGCISAVCTSLVAVLEPNGCDTIEYAGQTDARSKCVSSTSLATVSVAQVQGLSCD